MQEEISQYIAAEIGQTYVSDWLEVDQAMLNQFADATRDWNFLHVDPEAAGATEFGGTIAHGFLTLSLLPVLGAMTEGGRVSGVKMGVNYGGNKTRFIAPVRAGKRIRGVWKLTEMVEKRPGQWQQTCEITIEIEGEDKPGGAQGAGSQQVTQSYVLGGYAECDPDHPNDRAHEILADIKKALFGLTPDATRAERAGAEFSFGGRVKSVSYRGRDIGPRADGVPIVFAVVHIDVVFVEQLTQA